MATVYQHGTLGMLMEGLFAGTITWAEVLKHGDTGIGTLAGLNGEVIVINGEVYQGEASGKVNHITDLSTTTPFATVAFFDENAVAMTLPALYEGGLDRFAEEQQIQNTFALFELHGSFEHVKIRIAPKSEEPYPTLAEVADNQHEFVANEIDGTLLGFFSPALYEGAVVAGWHLHFISDDRTFGGHLLDYTAGDLEGNYQVFDDFNLHLPIQNQAFRDYHQDMQGLAESIRAAEGTAE